MKRSPEPQRFLVPDVVALDKLADELAPLLEVGDLVTLEGPLGVGKTTFVRGLLKAMGYGETVRSPTFNLVHLYETDPPVAHLDLYRLAAATGIGLEDLFETHVILVEWPDRLRELDPGVGWRIVMDFDATYEQPDRRSLTIAYGPRASAETPGQAGPSKGQ